MRIFIFNLFIIIFLSLLAASMIYLFTYLLTIPENILASYQIDKKTTILNIENDLQDYTLSCEIASLKMALNYKGLNLTEDDILTKTSFDNTTKTDIVWGDPNASFVGDIDGKICKTGYGIHWPAIKKISENWRTSEDFSDWTITNITREIINDNPVIVWGVLPNEKLTECNWFTTNGDLIKTYKQTHVRLVLGFEGDYNNPQKIILNDPLYGRLVWDTQYFLDNWKVFGNSGVAIR